MGLTHIETFSVTEWEEAQNNPEAFRDMEAAAYVVEETDKVDFSEILRESEELWFKSNSQGQAQGEQALDDTPEATVQQDEPGQVLSATAGDDQQSQIRGGSATIHDVLAPVERVMDMACTGEGCATQE